MEIRRKKNNISRTKFSFIKVVEFFSSLLFVSHFLIGWNENKSAKIISSFYLTLIINQSKKKKEVNNTTHLYMFRRKRFLILLRFLPPLWSRSLIEKNITFFLSSFWCGWANIIHNSIFWLDQRGTLVCNQLPGRLAQSTWLHLIIYFIH